MEAKTKLRQPSRKGKKAWRKNVDVSQVESGLDRARDETIKIGMPLTNASSDLLFAVDSTPDEAGLRKVGKKPLKVDEILSQRSAVPPLLSHKRGIEDEAAQLKKKGKVQGVTYKELGRLLRVAGRTADGKSSMAAIEAESREMSDVYDPWGESTKPADAKISARESRRLAKSAEHIKLSQTVSFAKPQQPPSTLSHAPLKFKEGGKAISVPEDGKSYNPSLDSWQHLLAEENVVLEKVEKQRIRDEEYKERIARLGELLDERERLGLDGASSDDDESSEAVNAKVEIKKEEDADKAQNEAVPATPDTKLNSKSKTVARSETIDLTKPKSDVRKHKLGKYRVLERPIEIKLSEELTDSLRLIKPEGNIAKDRFISLQERGIIEARIQITKGRKYKKHVTEKWSYKDIK
ncbi:ribosome biogenesis protein Nop53/GLTSCR2 [Lipomyces arxii]|uniref:ribosome biogenesis protein Nop53/GLTSCR2 n=1 Tax=Lipomyces arxii TaxID=56418 RepID=UPI0034CF514E